MPATLLASAVGAVVARLDLPASDASVDPLVPFVLDLLVGSDPPVLVALATPDVVRACVARVLSGPGPAAGPQRLFRVST